MKRLVLVFLVACAESVADPESTDAGVRDVVAVAMDSAPDSNMEIETEAKAPLLEPPPEDDGDAPGEQECHPPLCGHPDRPQHL